MKDSKDYSPKVTKLFRSLKRTHEVPEMPVYTDPMQAIIDGLVIEAMPLAEAARALKRMAKHFVDLNDLRVSRSEEILEVLRDTSPAAEKSAAAMTRVLNTIFDKFDKVALDNLTHEGKRHAKKELEELAGMTPFSISYCFLTALGGHAIPLNDRMLAYLRAHELVHPDADEHEIAGFLERQIAAKDAFAFYAVLKAEAEAGPVTSAADTATETGKTTAKKAAPKKTTAKKKTVQKKTAVKKKTAQKKTTKKK